ncbi:hypothetical protein D3C74_457940 [compost metagenome]
MAQYIADERGEHEHGKADMHQGVDIGPWRQQGILGSGIGRNGRTFVVVMMLSPS